jgi:hypothetical protein
VTDQGNLTPSVVLTMLLLFLLVGMLLFIAIRHCYRLPRCLRCGKSSTIMVGPSLRQHRMEFKCLWCGCLFVVEWPSFFR